MSTNTTIDFNSNEFETKSFGEKNRKLSLKNKLLPRKVRGVAYFDKRSYTSAHKACRMLTKANISNIIKNNNTEKINEYMTPMKYTNTYTWCDCTPYSPKYWM